MRTLNLLAASAVALILAAGATAAQADPVADSAWAAVSNDGGLGGHFVYNSGEALSSAWSRFGFQDGYPTDVVFLAEFGIAHTYLGNEETWDQQSAIASFGAPPLATPNFGETFFAPGNAHLYSFNFLIRNESFVTGAGNQNPVDARLVIAGFDGDHIVGSALYTQDITVAQGDGFIWTDVDDFNLQLRPGGQYIAFLTTQDINAVPEPATWALMIGGFGMAGAVLRRRRALAPAA